MMTRPTPTLSAPSPHDLERSAMWDCGYDQSSSRVRCSEALLDAGFSVVLICDRRSPPNVAASWDYRPGRASRDRCRSLPSWTGHAKLAANMPVFAQVGPDKVQIVAARKRFAGSDTMVGTTAPNDAAAIGWPTWAHQVSGRVPLPPVGPAISC